MEVNPVFSLGPIGVTVPVVTTWGIMLALVTLSWLATRSLQQKPGPTQVVLEGVIGAMDRAVREVLPNAATQVLPFIGTLWVFVVVANLVGIIPGLHSPTGALSTTAALAVLVFISVHWFGIRSEGMSAYLKHYLAPNPIMLPFHLMSEVTRTIALAIRLFGNIMSLEMTAMLVLLVAGFLVPVPLLMLHVIEALIQAYIFGMLTLIYIAGAIQSQQQRQSEKREPHA
ncbi:MAG: F0F1 ATP synthase subunit A [Nitrospira sp.]|nr:F0F1 ATP synthase subunit A [Nitrospira sp.]MDR4467604.1 F0F1 ATP synthase subunit A [Nitrospira sp.]